MAWGQVEILSCKIDTGLKGTYIACAALVHKCQDLVHTVKHTWCFEEYILMSCSTVES